MKKNKILIYLLSLIVICGCLFQYSTFDAYYQMENVNYFNLDSEEIDARYLKGTLDKGVMILNDLSYNSKDLYLMIEEFNRMGYHVYTIDFPSQGMSTGAIPFGYKSSQYLAEQYYTGVVSFSQVAHLSEEDIHIVSAGAAARSVLQTATKGFFDPQSLTFVSIDTNILKKIDFDIINFVEEENVAFINDLNISNPGEDIHIVASSGNDSSSIEENEALVEYLTRPSDDPVFATDNNVDLTIVDTLSSRDEMSNPEVIEAVVSHICNIDGVAYTKNNMINFSGPILWGLLGIIFIIIMLIYGSLKDNEFYATRNRELTKSYFLHKILAYIPGIFISAVIAMIIYYFVGRFIPVPYFSVIKIAIISGYGIVLYALYYRTNYGQDIGSDIFTKCEDRGNYSGGLTVLLIVSIGIILLTYGGLNIVMPLVSIKSLWIVIYSLLTWFIFYIDEKERNIFHMTPMERTIMCMINFGGIFINAIILLAFGFGNIAQDFMGLGVVIVFTLLIGKVLRAIQSPPILNALIKSIILNIFIIGPSILFF